MERGQDENGSELYVTTTGWHRPPYDRDPPEPTRAFMAAAEQFFEDAGIPYNDVSHEVLRARMQAPETFIITNDGHPNERGSELIARSVWPFIMEKLHEFCMEKLHEFWARRSGQEGGDAAMGKVLRSNERARGRDHCKGVTSGRPPLCAD